MSFCQPSSLLRDCFAVLFSWIQLHLQHLMVTSIFHASITEKNQYCQGAHQYASQNLLCLEIHQEQKTNTFVRQTPPNEPSLLSKICVSVYYSATVSLAISIVSTCSSFVFDSIECLHQSFPVQASNLHTCWEPLAPKTTYIDSRGGTCRMQILIKGQPSLLDSLQR